MLLVHLDQRDFSTNQLEAQRLKVLRLRIGTTLENRLHRVDQHTFSNGSAQFRSDRGSWIISLL